MKKFVSLLLALLMIASLAACGKKADDDKNNDDSLSILENVVTWNDVEPYRVLVQKGDPKGLLPGINKAIAELTANDGAKIKEIEEKVASQDVNTPDSVGTELPDTAPKSESGKPVLVVGTSPDYPPYVQCGSRAGLRSRQARRVSCTRRSTCWTRVWRTSDSSRVQQVERTVT